MGGKASAVGLATDSVFLEAAYFAPAALAGRARRLGLHTDASLRFERGVDPDGQLRAIERATELLVAICGGAAGPVTRAERMADAPVRAAVALRRDRLHAILGVDVPADTVRRIFASLEMRVSETEDGWAVQPPSFRFDIAIEEDLIEEIGRMFGYDRIPVTPARATERLGLATEQAVDVDRVADLLVARGYSEAITYSFTDPALQALVNPGETLVELANPIASDLAVLRRSLWPGLLAAARLNISRQRSRLKLFEIGPRFAAADDGVAEAAVVAGLALGSRLPEHWDGAGSDVDVFDIKADVEAVLRLTGASEEFRFRADSHPALIPGRTARVLRGDRPVGWLGALHPALQKELDTKRPAVLFALQLQALAPAAVPAFQRFSKFPSIRRDLAVVVDEGVSAEALTQVVRRTAGELLKELVVFDVYRGKGVDSRRKSMGLGLILQDASRTLTDEDADNKMRSVIESLERDFGATIRT
jgi:phenylalanyl-tRNA synthetase beta chain